MITIPPSLNSADANLALADSLAKLLDPKERAKIADDIKAHHALNDTESRKAEEARKIIAEHLSILEETKKISEQVAKDRKKLEEDRIKFAADIASDNVRVTEEKDRLDEKKKQNDGILKQAEEMKSDLVARELKLAEDRLALESEIKMLEEDRKSFVDAKGQRQSVLDNLDKEIASKREVIDALKKFNI